MAITVHNWKQLQELEKKRRTTLRAAQTGYFFVFTQTTGTIFETFFTDKLMWLCLLLYVSVRIAGTYSDSLEREAGLMVARTASLAGITRLGSFLVFMVQAALGKMTGSLAGNTGVGRSFRGLITELAFIVPTKLGESASLRLIRYMNAAHIIGYVARADGDYTKENFFDEINKEKKILTQEEMDTLDAKNMDGSGAIKVHLLLRWVLKIIQEGKEEGLMDKSEANQLRGLINKYRGNVAAINRESYPYPFLTYHLLTSLCVIYMPLFSLQMAFSSTSPSFTFDDITNVMVVVCQSMYVIGMRLMVSEFMDPFGTDTNDLSVMTYVLTTWKSSYMLVKKAKIDTKEEP